MEDQSILVTGGTGSFGNAFVNKILKETPNIKRLVIFSRDELKQYEMQLKFPEAKFPGIRFFLGDLRDQERVCQALEGIDTVVHAAALKQVPMAEYNPFEYIKTNVNGAHNLIQAAIRADVKNIVALSTDKAAAPVNLYGATKLCSDKLFIAANNFKGQRDLKISVVRYGNVLGSRGSVIPFFLKERESGILPITHKNMTRFTITLEKGVEMVIWAIQNALGGEVYIPKIPSYRISDVAAVIGPNCEHQIVGVRPGEKIHEELIVSAESLNTIDIGDYYAVLPAFIEDLRENLLKKHDGRPVPEGFSYDSGSNPNFLSRDELSLMIDKYLTGRG